MKVGKIPIPLQRRVKLHNYFAHRKCPGGACIACSISHQEAELVGFGSVFQPDAVHHGREVEQSGVRGWEHEGAAWEVARPRGKSVTGKSQG